MKRKITLKLWLAVVFGGIWQLVCKVFGFSSKSLFWRVVGATIAVCLLFIAVRVGVVWYNATKAPADDRWGEMYDGHVSPDYKYRNYGKCSGKSYIYDELTKKKMVTGLDWVAVPISRDSLMVVAKEGKRGYLNRFTLKETLPMKYDAAWSFSEGVAAVCEGDSVYFIDHSGAPINDAKYLRSRGYDNYVYHYGLAVIPCDGKYGAVDMTGNWVVPCTYKSVEINPESGIIVTRDDNVKQRLDYDGQLLDDFVVDNTYFITYYTDEFDAEGNQEQAVADMLKYSAGPYFGLMTKGGVAVTKPLYTSVECIRPGVYQCQLASARESVIINNKGEKIDALR